MHMHVKEKNSFGRCWTQRTGKAIERYHPFSGFTLPALKFR